MQILEDAETRVEPDQIHELEWTHRVVEPEPEGLVDVASGRDAFHQHVEGLVAYRGVHASGDETRRLVDEHGLLLHRPSDTLDHLDSLRARLECSHDLDELHLVHGVEKVHAGDARRSRERSGHLGDAERRRVGRDDRRGRRRAFDIGEQLQLEIHAFGRALDHEVRSPERRIHVTRRRQPLEAGVGLSRGRFAELDRRAEDFVDARARALELWRGDVEQAGLIAGGRGRMRHAMTHRAGAENSESRDSHAPDLTTDAVRRAVRRSSRSRDRSRRPCCRSAARCGCPPWDDGPRGRCGRSAAR